MPAGQRRSVGRSVRDWPRNRHRPGGGNVTRSPPRPTKDRCVAAPPPACRLLAPPVGLERMRLGLLQSATVLGTKGRPWESMKDRQHDTDPSAPPTLDEERVARGSVKPTAATPGLPPAARYAKPPLINGRENDSIDDYFQAWMKKPAQRAGRHRPRLPEDEVDQELPPDLPPQAPSAPRPTTTEPSPRQQRVAEKAAGIPPRRKIALLLLVLFALVGAGVVAIFLAMRSTMPFPRTSGGAAQPRSASSEAASRSASNDPPVETSAPIPPPPAPSEVADRAPQTASSVSDAMPSAASPGPKQVNGRAVQRPEQHVAAPAATPPEPLTTPPARPPLSPPSAPAPATTAIREFNVLQGDRQ